MKQMIATGFGRAVRAAARFGRDRRGGTAIQALVMLPVVLAALGLGSLLWETIAIRRSLHTGTYLATRFLSLYPPREIAPGPWEDVARMFVYRELKNNPWVNPTQIDGITDQGDPITRVTVQLAGGYNCGEQFTITSIYQLRVLPGDVGERVLPYDMRLLRLEEVRTGEVICE